MTKSAIRAAQSAAEHSLPDKPNFLIDAARDEKETKILSNALEVLEQRGKEILMHAKTGLTCEHREDKEHAIERIAELTRDANRVAEQLRISLLDGIVRKGRTA